MKLNVFLAIILMAAGATLATPGKNHHFHCNHPAHHHEDIRIQEAKPTRRIPKLYELMAFPDFLVNSTSKNGIIEEAKQFSLTVHENISTEENIPQADLPLKEFGVWEEDNSIPGSDPWVANSSELLENGISDEILENIDEANLLLKEFRVWKEDNSVPGSDPWVANSSELLGNGISDDILENIAEANIPLKEFGVWEEDNSVPDSDHWVANSSELLENGISDEILENYTEVHGNCSHCTKGFGNTTKIKSFDCMCALFTTNYATEYDVPLTLRTFQNVSCHVKVPSGDVCMKVCISITTMSNDLKDDIVCAVVSGHATNLTAFLQSKLCGEDTTWTYTGVSSPTPICCHMGEPLPC